MSDLAQQLRKRKDQAVGNTQRSVHVKPSLLFDGREAARIETTAIHLLALGGLDQLKKLEPRLKSFEATLFASPSNTELNRESQTSEANRRLDEAIESFLSLVSPFFLLKASHKCLEYLIRRYSIHEHNKNALLKCMVPYHASNVFVRVVQLMPLKQTPWQFLEQCKKNGVPLDRKVLVEHAAKNRSILTFVAETVKEYIANKAQCKSLIAFFVALTLETIARSGDIDSELVSALLPHLLHGFKSKNSDYQLSSMMITCALCSTPQKSRGLDRSLLSSLLTAVVQHAHPHHHQHALLAALVVLSDERLVQDDTCQLSETTFDTLVQWRDFTALLKEVVAQGYAIDNLMRPFFRSLTQVVISRPELTEVLISLIKEVPVGAQIAALVGELLTLFEANYSALEHNATLSAALKEVLHAIDRRYPNELDQGIELQLRGLTARTQPTWMTLFVDTRHHPLALTERNNSDYTTVASGLKALTRPRARVLALDHLLALARDELAPLISGTLMLHLADDDLDLVLHALQVPDLVARVEAAALFGTLSSLLSQARVQRNKHVLSQALHVMTQPFIELHPQYTERALPYLVNHVLFLTDSLEVNTQALKIALTYPHELFYAFKSDAALTAVVSHVSQRDLNVHVIEALARAIATRPALQEVVTRLVASSRVPVHVPATMQLALIRALHVTAEDTRLALANLALEICARDWQFEHVTNIAPSIDQHEGLPNWDTPAFEEFLARRPARVSEFQFYALRHVLKSVTKNGITDAYSFVNGGLHGLLAKLFIVMTSSGPDLTSFDQHLKLLFSFLGSQLTNFLAYFWTEPEISPLISVRSLRVLNTWLKSATVEHVTRALPPLLAALAHSSPHVRAAALACVTTLASGTAISPLSPLASRILAQAAEFVASPKHVHTWTRAVWGLNSTPVRLGDSERAEQLETLTAGTLTSPLTWVRVKLLAACHAIDDATLRAQLISRTAPHLTALLTRLQVTGATVTLAEARLIETLLRYYSAALPHRSVAEVQPWLTAMMLQFEKYFCSATRDSSDDITIFGAEDPTIDQDAFPYVFNPARLALECVHDTVYAAAARDVQAALFATVLSLMLSPQAKLRALAQGVMRRRISAVEPALVSHELATCHREISAVIERHSPNTRKRQKSSVNDTPSSALTPEMERDLDAHLTRVTALLETFQFRPQFLAREHVPLLFALVDLIIDQQHSVGKHPSIEYITQQVLASLTLVTQALVDQPAQVTALAAQFHVDSIVQVIRVSQDPSVQKNALLFLAAAARVFPSRVLEHIMPIFTYMGASSVRFDDNYTFLVIQKTIEAVVPALVQARDTLAPLTLFAAFVQHIGEIPAHRRLLLFSMLLKILGAQYLSVLLALLFFKHVRTAGTLTAVKARPDSIVDFCRELCLKLEPREVLHGFNLFLGKCNDAVTYFQKQRRGESVADLAHDLASHGIDKHVTEQEMVHVTGDFVRFVSQYVSGKELVQQLIELDGALEAETQGLCLTLLETALLRVKQLQTALSGEHVLREEVKRQVDDSYELIDRCNELLSIPSFVQVIERLLRHDDTQLQRRALLLLNDRVTLWQRSLHTKHAVPFIKMTRQLTDVIVADILLHGGKDFALTGATAVNKQTAALSLEIIIRSFGERKEFAADFKEMLAPLTAALRTINSSAQSSPADLSHKVKVSSSLLLCLASLVGALGPALLEHVNEFYPVLLDVMDLALSSRQSDAALSESLRLLQLSTLSALKVIVAAIGKFLGKYLARTLIAVVHPALVEARNPQLQSQLLDLLHVTAAQIDLRQLLSPLALAYQHALAHYQNLHSVHHVVTLLARVTAALDKKHVPVHHKPLFKFYLQLFDLRHEWSARTQGPVYAEHGLVYAADPKKKGKTALTGSAEQLAQIELIETELIEGFLNMVMKLNENTFKPLYLVTMEWTHVNHVVSASTSDAMAAVTVPPAQLFGRTYVFYKLNLALQHQLKSIFSPYLSHVIDHVTAILARPSLITSQLYAWMAIEIPLMKWLALALQQTTVGSFDKRRFDKLSVPLTALIDRSTAPPSPPLAVELYRARVARVIKVLSALSQAVHHEALWKSLNHQLLLLARHEDSHVRESAVRALIEQYKVLGEEYLPLLPESIQSISELMEDSNAEVEACTLQLIKIIEDLLGQEFAELLK